MRIEVRAGHLRHERRNVLDQTAASMAGSSCALTNAAMVPVSSVNGATAAITSCCSLSNSGVGLATMPATADVLARGVVIFERLQLHAVHLGAGEHLADRGVDLVEVRRADETLEHRDVRTVRRHPSAKPFGKTSSRRALLASACWSIVASGSSKMSMAVTGFCLALDVCATERAEDDPSTAKTFIYLSIRSPVVDGDGSPTAYLVLQFLWS